MHRWPCFRNASALALVACALPAAAAAECPARGAIYELAVSDTPPVVIRLAQAPVPGPSGDLVVEVSRHGAPDAPVLRLQPIMAMGHGGMRLFPVPDAGADPVDMPDHPGLPVMGMIFGADDRLYPLPEGLPQPADMAPEAIVIMGLAAELWYGSNGGTEAVSITDGVWYRTACGA
jgi:hypothetical protein